jgi:nitrate/TMAO reductase-like tetraheme cytochrome c subunit
VEYAKLRGMKRPRPRFRRLWILGSVAAIAAAFFVLGWAITDHLEQDNDFCTSCHLEPNVPLHTEVRQNFDAHPPASLASLHGSLEVASREDAGFRCIDCHGGASWLGRARVKALAALDSFWYVVGYFEEPHEMAWPLWDEDCQKCHLDFGDTRSAPWEDPRFHELSLHNVDLGLDCVECHRAHDPAGAPNHYHLRANWVRAQCARCHSEFQEVTR